MKYRLSGVIGVLLICLTSAVQAEDIRVLIAGSAEVSLDTTTGTPVPLSYSDSVLIQLGQETRFFRGIELEFTVPQHYLPHRGSLALGIYAELDKKPALGVVDIVARQISFEPIPNKIQTIYQIPLRTGHGLRTTPYVTVLNSIVPPASFPIIFRIMPVIKGLSEEVETMRFTLNVKPILSDEGVVKIIPRYPEQLQDRPFTVLIDDEVIERPEDERLLREGEHSLVILSNDYRNESRRFMVERGKFLDLTVHLQDPTPLIIFEAPENAEIFFDNQPLGSNPGTISAEPGTHEIRFRLSDYSILRSINVQKGKTYRVVMSVDVDVAEFD